MRESLRIGRYTILVFNSSSAYVRAEQDCKTDEADFTDLNGFLKKPAKNNPFHLFHPFSHPSDSVGLST